MWAARRDTIHTVEFGLERKIQTLVEYTVLQSIGIRLAAAGAYR